MAKKNNKAMWVIGIIVLIMFMSNGGFLGSVTYTSKEPTTLEGYKNKLLNTEVEGVLLDYYELDSPGVILLGSQEPTNLFFGIAELSESPFDAMPLTAPCDDDEVRDTIIGTPFLEDYQFVKLNGIDAHIYDNTQDVFNAIAFCSDDKKFFISIGYDANIYNRDNIIQHYSNLMYTTVQDNNDNNNQPFGPFYGVIKWLGEHPIPNNCGDVLFVCGSVFVNFGLWILLTLFILSKLMFRR